MGQSKDKVEEMALETTPLCVVLPSASSTDKSSYASLVPSGFSEASLYFTSPQENIQDEERSTGSLDLEIPAHLANTDEARARKCWLVFGKATAVFLAMSLAAMAVLLLKPIVITKGSASSASSTVPILLDEYLPFSQLDPVNDMNVFNMQRPLESSPPSHVTRQAGHAVPTSQWFQNLVLLRGQPSALQRVYTVPYILDPVGPIPGVNLHPNHIDGSNTVIQLAYDEQVGLTLGCASSLKYPSTKELSMLYSVVETTPLGITLQWNASKMTSSLVRGMPYATMIYSNDEEGKTVPTIASRISLRSNPIADQNTEITCEDGGPGKGYLVERELQMTFGESDFTWLAFFSRPVMLRCATDAMGAAKVAIQFTAVDDVITEELPFVARIALLTNCTTGANPRFCQQGKAHDNEAYAELLRTHYDIYPGQNTAINYKIDDENDAAIVSLHWDAQSMSGKNDVSQLINYALPHQRDRLEDASEHCTPVLLGHACIGTGSVWNLKEVLPRVSFLAPRPPRPSAIPSLSKALQQDLGYTIPDYYMRGVGDTYFSGKMLGKAARILAIADEVKDLCNPESDLPTLTVEDRKAYNDVCGDATIPTDADTQPLLDILRRGAEIWINGSAEAPFIYDSGWGGMINCGCLFDDATYTCRNKFPDCPSISDPGLNFGNGFYNDHHFHYGYHIYAAAAVAKYDPEWGRKHFEPVNLLIRDIANPSAADSKFPMFRHKDWYEGHSWASGVSSPVLNGKNQESSSESIAAYEAVALYGTVMTGVWEDCTTCQDREEQVRVSKDIRDVGRLLTATEIRSTDRYWHVRLNNEHLGIYPETYNQNVIGILWNTMAQFQTWFGGAPYLAYGIQLLPITPIAEQRDDPAWLAELYEPFADACNEAKACETDGWSVLQLSVLAGVGHADRALERANALSSDVFETAGGNGHSLSNTLWFLATRPDATPIKLPKSDTKIPTLPDEDKPGEKVHQLTDCGVPDTCTGAELDRDANGSSCRERITWLMEIMHNSQHKACKTVASVEYPNVCGGCSPNDEASNDDDDSLDTAPSADCPPCESDVCDSRLNRCPIFDRTFVCSGGPSTGGCQSSPWPITDSQCHECCELTQCPKKVTIAKVKEIDPSICPPCESSICNSRLNLCPEDAAPYLCIKGASVGGCSPTPWDLSVDNPWSKDKICDKCCTVIEGCKVSQPSLVP